MKNIFLGLLLAACASANAIEFTLTPDSGTTVVEGGSLDFTFGVTLTGSESLSLFDFSSSLTPTDFDVDLANWSDASLGSNVSASADFAPFIGDLTAPGFYTVGTLTYAFNSVGTETLSFSNVDPDGAGPEETSVFRADAGFTSYAATEVTLFSPIDITVTAIPEPGLLLASAGALGFLAARRRRQLPAAA